MYGNIILDLFFIKSYNFGFLFTNSDIIISLLSWQYWWWFWFSFIISLYYLLIIKYITIRNLKFFPKIVTSYKSHGKWGDVIVCLLPVSWCLNILSNSTTLLKILEWQSEASLVTIRVRGKQWYWVYKIDIKSFINTISSNFYNLKLGTYSNILNNASSVNEFIVYNQTVPYNYNNFNIFKINKNKGDFSINTTHINKVNLNKSNLNNNTVVNFIKINSTYSTNDNFVSFTQINNTDLLDKRKFNNNYINLTTNNKLNINNNFYRTTNYYNYILVKQKSITDWSKTISNSLLCDRQLTNLNNENFDSLTYINNIRLLKVNNILVLPTSTFINIITNSYDVIHSWFIPGLGIKMDCIPGRSTHHTLYIDTPGMYYGQCAEICGRLHHHMPIKICALYLDHYYLWFLHNFSTQNTFTNKSNYL